jgi:dTDP-4-amino-4,6-dideoxygalactose transaminase
VRELAIHGGTPTRTKPYPAWPVHGPEERAALQRVLDSGEWSAVGGPHVRELERRFAAYQDARHAVAVTNGTTALVLALRALGVGSGDEVVVPPYTFLATASAVLEVDALPVFADIDPDTYCIDPAAVEAALTPRTKAVIAVHLAGQPADMARLCGIAGRRGIAIVEDAAHAHGAAYAGRRVGAIGDIGCWSFQASKNMTAGEGGMVTTDDDALAVALESLHDCGRSPEGAWYEHHVLGGNHRLTEWQSAVLLAQLARLPGQVAHRESMAEILDRELARVPGISPLARHPGVDVHAHHLYVLRYEPDVFDGLSRDAFVAALQAEGIPASAGYPIPLNRQPLFANAAFDHRATGYDPDHPPTRYAELALPATETACAEAVWLPQRVLLAEPNDIADVVEAVAKVQRGQVSARTHMTGP